MIPPGGERPGCGPVVVTGASRGIGKATALAFARRGLPVALLGRRTTDLEPVAREVAALGGRALVATCDVAIEAAVERARAAVLEGLGVPHVVVNNAGAVHRGPRVEEVTVADWDRIVGTNLRGPFLVSRAFLPGMRAAGRGRLIHVASISSTLGSPGAASYAASKWGLIGLHKSLAEELRGSGVQSIAILPGSVDTEMLAGSGFSPAMTADDVAAEIVHLALDAPDAVHGSSVEMFG